MPEDANVFNTFSFKKWSDQKKEEELDSESRRRRAQQIKRLKEKLRRERLLREQGGGGGTGDIDLEALIQAIQNAEQEGGGGGGNPAVEPDDDHILAELRRTAYQPTVVESRAYAPTTTPAMSTPMFQYNRYVTNS